MNNIEKTITVTGRGNIHIVPDVIRVDLHIKCIFDTYDTAYRMAEANLQDISRVMLACSLSPKLPKTTEFNIDKAYKSIYIKGQYTGEEKLVGYELTQHVRINLDMDTTLLARVLKLLGDNLTEAEINVGYTVRDPRPHQLKMLERAVKDASERAAIMAQAAGCQLGDVKTIDYSEHELHIYSQARHMSEPGAAVSCTESSLDITPEDLVGGEDVTVTWFLV